MKGSLLALAGGLAALAAAQQPAQIPDCAVPCISDAIIRDTNCTGLQDFACVCAALPQIEVNDVAIDCLVRACPDINAVITAANQICQTGESIKTTPSEAAVEADGGNAVAADPAPTTSCTTTTAVAIPTAVPAVPTVPVVAAAATARDLVGGGNAALVLLLGLLAL